MPKLNMYLFTHIALLCLRFLLPHFSLDISIIIYWCLIILRYLFFSLKKDIPSYHFHRSLVLFKKACIRLAFLRNINFPTYLVYFVCYF